MKICAAAVVTNVTACHYQLLNSAFTSVFLLSAYQLCVYFRPLRTSLTKGCESLRSNYNLGSTVTRKRSASIVTPRIDSRLPALPPTAPKAALLPLSLHSKKGIRGRERAVGQQAAVDTEARSRRRRLPHGSRRRPRRSPALAEPCPHVACSRYVRARLAPRLRFHPARRWSFAQSGQECSNLVAAPTLRSSSYGRPGPSCQ